MDRLGLLEDTVRFTKVKNYIPKYYSHKAFSHVCVFRKSNCSDDLLDEDIVSRFNFVKCNDYLLVL